MKKRQRSTEGIYLEGKRESFSLPVRGMTHLLPADIRMDGDKEEGDGQRNMEGRTSVTKVGEKDMEKQGGKKRWRMNETSCVVVHVTTYVQRKTEKDLKPKASSEILPTLSACPTGCVREDDLRHKFPCRQLHLADCCRTRVYCL